MTGSRYQAPRRAGANLSFAKATADTDRILVLDGIRGVALCMVLVQHFFGTRDGIGLLGAFDRRVWGFVDSFWWTIDSFFVLSAFLITGILMGMKGSERYFLDFYARRTLRVFPLYYASLFLFFVVLPLVPHPLAAAYVADSAPDQVWFWTYLTNFRMAYNGDWYNFLVPTVFWSLAVEEQFYLVWPVVVLYFGRRRLIQLCLWLIGVALAVRVALAVVEVHPIATFVLTPAKMDCLALGALLALIRPDGRAWATIGRLAPSVTLACVVVLILLALPTGKLDWHDPLTNTLGFSVTGAMCAGIVTMAVQAPPGARIRRLLETPTLLKLGKYSYAMYIFHGPAGSVVKLFYDFDRAPLVAGSALPLTLVYSLLAFLVSLAAGWLSWRLLERPFLRLQARFGGTSLQVEARPGAITAHRPEVRGAGNSGVGMTISEYMHRRFSCPWLANAVRERGLGPSLRAAVPFFIKVARLWWWDRKHNVSTRDRVFIGGLELPGPNALHAGAYEATDTTLLPRLLRGLSIHHSDFVFVDLGAGKGQALFLAAEFPFKRIVGVELSPLLCEMALRNRRTFRSTTQRCQNIDVIRGDAVEFTFPGDPLVIYMFNSFDDIVLAQVLKKLIGSVERRPREVVFIYHNPKHRSVIESAGVFTLLLSGRDERDFRKLGYDVYRYLPTTALVASS